MNEIGYDVAIPGNHEFDYGMDQIHTYIPSSVTTDENGMFTGVAGEYRVKNVRIAGEPLEQDRTYTLASHGYLLKNQGGGMTMFDDCTLLPDEVALDNQVLISYITDTSGRVDGEEYANPYGQGRIVAVEEAPQE